MLPVVAIVGRPNVGKSTLFNRLTRTRDALITDFAGTTRDRQYGDVHFADRHFILIDTGGITEDKSDDMGGYITEQAQLAIEEADQILFVVDAKSGLTPDDRDIAKTLRRSSKPVHLIMNKSDGRDKTVVTAEGHELGMGEPIAISAAHGGGVSELIESLFPEPSQEEEPTEEDSSIKLAIVGRPNVGKSTLTNRILGEERVIVHDAPGTTRDSICIPLEHHGTQYTIIDTAGVRKRKKVANLPEKFSIVKTLKAIEESHVVLYVIDGRVKVSEQDMKLLNFVLECGKALVVAINKWDGMEEYDREQARLSADRQLDFVKFAKLHYISALHGSGVGNLFDSVKEAYESANKPLVTSKLTKLLEQAVAGHQPPLVKGRRIKLRYANPGGNNPPKIIIHGNQVKSLPDTYKKYLAGFYQKKLGLVGTPVHLIFKSGENPYADKKK